MKILLIILLTFLSYSSIAQVRIFLGPKGIFIYDTTKTIGTNSTYITIPNDSTMGFDSSKVGVSLVKNATRDSIRLISGSGSILATVKDSVGSGGGGGISTASNGLVIHSPNVKLIDTAASGAGTKFSFGGASKGGAIRAGAVNGTQWDFSNIGSSSTSFGNNNIASSAYSTAIGNGNTASTSSSAFALGDGNTATGAISVAIGGSNIANNSNSFAFGFSNTASGTPSTAIGRSATASGANSMAFGYFSNASGSASSLLGGGLVSKSFGGTVVGYFNEATAANNATAYSLTNRAFQVGIGTATGAEGNAITTLFNGNTGFGRLVPDGYLDVDGGTAGGKTPIIIHYVSPIATSSISTGGGNVTITFPTQAAIPFPVDSYVEVAGVTPAGYNGTYRVNAASTSTVRFVNATTGAQTVAGTVSIGALNTTSKEGALERDSISLRWTSGTGSNKKTHYVTNSLTNTATLNFDLTAVNYQDLTITVTGAVDGDAVTIGAPNGAVVADVTYFGWVSAANTVTIRCSRVGGGGAADPASGTFRASVIKY